MIKAMSIHSRQQTRTATITPNTMPTTDPVGRRYPGGEDTGLGTGWMKVESLQFWPASLLAHTVTLCILSLSISSFSRMSTQWSFVPFGLQLASAALTVALNSTTSRSSLVSLSWFLDPVIWIMTMYVSTGRRSCLSMVQVTVKPSFSFSTFTILGLFGSPVMWSRNTQSKYYMTILISTLKLLWQCMLVTSSDFGLEVP